MEAPAPPATIVGGARWRGLFPAHAAWPSWPAWQHGFAPQPCPPAMCQWEGWKQRAHQPRSPQIQPEQLAGASILHPPTQLPDSCRQEPWLGAGLSTTLGTGGKGWGNGACWLGSEKARLGLCNEGSAPHSAPGSQRGRQLSFELQLLAAVIRQLWEQGEQSRLLCSPPTGSGPGLRSGDSAPLPPVSGVVDSPAVSHGSCLQPSGSWAGGRTEAPAMQSPPSCSGDLGVGNRAPHLYSDLEGEILSPLPPAGFYYPVLGSL